MLSCDPGITPCESGVLSDPALIDEQFRNTWLPYFCRAGRGLLIPLFFDAEVGGWLPTLSKVEFPPLVGQDLFDVVQKKKPTADGLDGWGKDLPLAWCDCLAIILSRVQFDGIWPEGLLDAYIDLIPRLMENLLLWGRGLCVHFLLFTDSGLQFGWGLTGWCQSWMPDSVFSDGGGRSSVETWYSTALEIEEALVSQGDFHVHLFVADVVKSFDTVDRGVLDFVLGRLGLPGWFRRVYFSYHAGVRLRFKLSCGLGQPWVRDGGIP